MEPTNRRREASKDLLLVLFPVLLSIAYVLHAAPTLLADCLRNMDRELTHLAVLQGKEFEAFSGAFSRFGFRHPGPFHFYVLALGDLAIPNSLLSAVEHSHARLKLVALFFNALALGLGSLILSRVCGNRLLGFVLVPLLLFLTFDPQRFYFLDYWNPNFVPPLFILFMLSLVVVMRGHAFAIAAALPLACIIIQAHLGSTLVCFTLLAFAVLTAAATSEKLRSASCWVKPILCAVCICLFLCAPVIYDAIVFENFGNLGRLADFFFAERDGRGGARSLHSLLGFFRLESGLSSRLIALAFILGLFSGWVRPSTHGIRMLSLVTLAALPISFLSITMIHGPFHSYLVSFIYSVIALGLVVCIAQLGGLTERLVGSRAQSALITSLGITLLLLAIPPTPKVKDCEFRERVEKFVQRISGDGAFRLELPEENPPYRFAARFLLEAKLRGMEICVEDEWGYLYGDALRCTYRFSEMHETLPQLLLTPASETEEIPGLFRFALGKVAMFYPKPGSETEPSLEITPE